MRTNDAPCRFFDQLVGRKTTLGTIDREAGGNDQGAGYLRCYRAGTSSVARAAASDLGRRGGGDPPVRPAGFFYGPTSVTIPFISEYRRRSDVPTPIEQAVNVFVSLGNRRRLEDMKLQRQRAVLELQGQPGVSGPIRQLEDEIAVIDAGLEKLPPSKPTV
jgi:hypothetical protein